MTTNLPSDSRRILDRLDVLRHPSDLDVVLFFARHPRTLLSTELLGAFLGYGVKQIASSLDLLLDAGLLTRTPNGRHAARMYVFVVPNDSDDWLPGLLRLAATRHGRLDLIRAIKARSPGRPDATVDGAQSCSADLPDTRPFPGGRVDAKGWRGASSRRTVNGTMEIDDGGR